MVAPNKSFPFWMLIYRDGLSWRPVVRETGYALAFTSTDRALDYFAAHSHSQWEFRLMCRETLARVEKTFREQGLQGLALDADDGTPGHRVAFDAL